MEDALYSKIESFPWVNWSEVARESIRKREILEKYLRSGSLSDADQSFCEKADWHPVDELPLNKKFINELKAAQEEPVTEIVSISEILE